MTKSTSLISSQLMPDSSPCALRSQEPALESFFSFTQTSEELLLHSSQSFIFLGHKVFFSRTRKVNNHSSNKYLLSTHWVSHTVLRWRHGNEQKSQSVGVPSSSLAGEPTIENHLSTDGLKSHQCHKEACMMGKPNLRGWDRERCSGSNDIPRPAGWKELGHSAPGEGHSMCSVHVWHLRNQKKINMVAAAETKGRMAQRRLGPC